MSVVQTSALLGLLVLGGCVSTIRSSRPIPDSQTVDRITPLKTHLKDTQVGPAAPRLLVDLAEAYLEQARVLTLESIESGTEVDEFQLRYLAEQAAATYTVLAASYPKWPPRPRALLTLGNLLNQLEDTEEANQWFDRLVERYPNSTQAAQVLLRRGRDKVHSGDNSQAIALLSALSGRDDALGARAHYWLAWAYRNQGKEVVAFEHYAIAAKRASALKLDIHREAIQDSIVVFDTVHPRDPGVETYRDLAHDRGVYLEALERIQRRAQGLDEAEHALAVGREVLRLSNDVERVEDRAIGLYRAHIDSETRHLIAADIARRLRDRYPGSDVLARDDPRGLLPGRPGLRRLADGVRRAVRALAG